MRRKQTKETRLWAAYHKDRSDVNRNRLAEHYLPWVKLFVQGRHMAFGPVDENDLCQACSITLLELIDRYEPKKATFKAFASQRLRGAMRDYFRDYVDFLPRLARQRHEHFGQFWHQFIGKHGYRPSFKDLKKQFPTGRGAYSHHKIGKRAWKNIINSYLAGTIQDIAFLSMESTQGMTKQHGHKGLSLADSIPQTIEPAPDQLIADKEFWLEITKSLQSSWKMAVILYFRCGLTMKEIGPCLGVSESRVSQILTLSLKILKNTKTANQYMRLATGE